ncbi:MAG: uroporphyrinogen-III synthase [Elusimicrobiota bacterium]
MTILITRPKDQAKNLAKSLEESGFRSECIPVIRIGHPSSYQKLDWALKHLNAYDAAAFASANAVEKFFARSAALGMIRPKAPRQVFAVGPATAAALRKHGWLVKKPPAIHTAAALAQNFGSAKGLSVLIPRTNDGRTDIIRILRAKGARVYPVETYRILADRRRTKRLLRIVQNRGFDAVIFFSGSAARSFKNQIGELWRQVSRECLIVSIGPSTSRVLRLLGARRVLEAPSANSKSVLAAIVDWAARGTSF